jgi:threonine dehydratase
MKAGRDPDSITLSDVLSARVRIKGAVPRTPMVRIEVESGELYLKLENIQPIRSFKLRGAFNAISTLSPLQLEHGVYTASAGNMAQGLAWAARHKGVACTAVIPDGAPRTKIDGIRRLGAEIVSLPYDDWWNVLATHVYRPLEPARFIHPVSNVDMMAGNGTIGLEILEDVPEVDEVLVPFGGGGLSCGIAVAIRARRPEVKIYGCEVETAAPLRAALVAGRVVECPRQATFVDGIGARTMLAEMWAPARRLLAGSLVVSLAEVAAAIRFLIERTAVAAEGAGGASVAAGLQRIADGRRLVCVVSGGNIDLSVLATILQGAVP